MSKPIFVCARCSACCQGKGGIYLRKDQIADAAHELGLKADEFIARYCRQDGDRYEVLSGEDGNCLLLGPQGCRIHKSKPEICRLWPFFPGILKDASAFEEAKLACPGINPQATHQEFVAHAKKVLSGGEQ